MSKLIEELKRYFQESPREDIDFDWESEEIQRLSQMGPDALEYIDYVISCQPQQAETIDDNRFDQQNLPYTSDISFNQAA